MNRKELLAATPEALGISSREIIRFIRELEASGTEMHGFMLLRHGRLAAKGWWKPFAQGIAHSSQSLTKTFTGAAYGVAEKEGILHLEERLIDIFPEYAPNTTGPYWDQLKVRHILTMASGMETMPSIKDEQWVKKFFDIPIVHEPGTALFYNSAACSMVGACIKKKTGLGLKEYLSSRLFDKIGIDPETVGWINHADGLQNGSGGIITTTEDNARLIQLFLNKGKWDDEQIISPEWAEMAVKLQNKGDNPEAVSGYGGMMWIREGAFYADGAMGQLSVGFPNEDMVISLNQTVADAKANEKMLELLFSFREKVSKEALPEDEAAYAELLGVCGTLSLPAAPYAPYSSCADRINGRRYVIQQGEAAFFAEDVGTIFNDAYHDYASAFTFNFLKDRMLELTIESASGKHQALAGMDGSGFSNRLESLIPLKKVILSAYWKEEEELVLGIRWLENCRTRSIVFRFQETTAEITSLQQSVGGFDVPPLKAFAVWE